LVRDVLPGLSYAMRVSFGIHVLMKSRRFSLGA
jgi:hypothetical protein